MQQTLEYTDTLRQGTDKINEMTEDLYGILASVPIVSITGATSLDATAFGKLHICTGTSADYTVDLPTAVGNDGFTISFKGGDSAALTKIVTVDANGSQTINGLLTRPFTYEGGFTLISDGANWRVLHETPSAISYTPTLVGWSGSPTVTCRYCLNGRMVTVSIIVSGTSNSTSTSFTLPPNLSALSGSWFIGRAANNGTGTLCYIDMPSATSVVPLYTSVTGSAWTASGTKQVLFTITYYI